MKSLVVLLVLAAFAQACLAVPAGTPADAPIPVPAPAAPAAAKPEEAVKPEDVAVPAAPAVPAAAAPTVAPAAPPAPGTTASPARLAPPLPATPAAPADSGDKLGHLMAAPALNSTKGAISVQVLPPLLPKCSEDNECTALLGRHAACRDFWCECVDGAKYEGGFSKRCLRDAAALGDSCKEAGDCRRIANTYCKAGSCHCNKDFVFSNSGTACLPVATAADASCTEDRQCVRLLNSVAGPEGPAVCVAGKCMCRYDHVLENGTCVHKQDDAAPPDEPMQGDQPAAPGPTTPTRGKSCAADAECADLDGGACVQGVCGCKQEYVPAVAANKCLPVLRELAAACEEDIQCSEGLGDLGRCQAAKCACPDGAALSADAKKCACAEGEVLNKAANRCEKTAPAAQQQPIKEGAVRNANKDNGAAGTLQASVTIVALLAAYCAL